MSERAIDHTAVVVADLEEALLRYERLFGVRASEHGTVPEQRVRVAFLPFGESSLELIQPTDGESGVARFLASHGEALHHVGISVPDVEAELRRLEKAGFELIDRIPRRGFHGLIAFVHPRAAGGVLYELVERRAP